MHLRTILIQLIVCTVLVSAVFAAGCNNSSTSTPPAAAQYTPTLAPLQTASSSAESGDPAHLGTVTTTPVHPPIQTSSMPPSAIVVTSDPAGATIILDNKVKGITPLTLDYVPNGDHTIVLQLNGYQNRTIDVTVASNVKTIDVTLQPDLKPTESATTQATTSVTTSVTESTTTSATTQATTSATTQETTAATTSQSVTITQISPTYIRGGVSSATTQTISITGTGLTTAAGMKLTGMNTITATTYTAASDSSATGEFSIPAATTGSYSVVLVDSSGTTLATSTTSVAIASYS